MRDDAKKVLDAISHISMRERDFHELYKDWLYDIFDDDYEADKIIYSQDLELIISTVIDEGKKKGYGAYTVERLVESIEDFYTP